jgi:hypothetical protein
METGFNAVSSLGNFGAQPLPPRAVKTPDLLANNASPHDSPELREAFDGFVGEMFYGQMMEAMRSTVGEAAYFHGGRAEEIFQGQLDQVMSEKLADATANSFTGPMYELFTLGRQ